MYNAFDSHISGSLIVDRQYEFNRTARLTNRSNRFMVMLYNHKLYSKNFFSSHFSCGYHFQIFASLPSTIFTNVNTMSSVFLNTLPLLSFSTLILTKILFFFPPWNYLRPSGIITVLGVKWLKILMVNTISKIKYISRIYV